jgi:DNA-binding transcriptional ArsR family regulator
MDEVIAIARALGDENRLRAVLALRGGEMCVCQLVELLGLANSTVSKHMSILKAAGLVESEKRGRWVHYRLAGRRSGTFEGSACPDGRGGGVPAPVRDALKWALESGSRSTKAQEDGRRLRKILEMDPEELCRLQDRS